MARRQPIVHSIELSRELDRQLRAAAEQCGQTVDEYLRSLVERTLSGVSSGPASRQVGPAGQPRRVLTGLGKFAHMSFTVDDFLRERHEEALREAEKDRRQGQQP